MSEYDRLDGYVRGAMSDEEAAAYEEELFARAGGGEAPELVYYDAMAAAVRAMVLRGTFELYVTARDVARLEAIGLRIQRVDVANTRARHRYRIERDAQLVIARFPVDLAGVRSVDMEIWAGDRQLKVMKDVSFDAEDGAIFFCCEGELARKTAGFWATSRMYANEPDGRRLLAEIETFAEVA